MNKEELNKEIEKLKVSLSAHEEQVRELQSLLEVAEKKLVDADKPKLTEKQLQAIESVIDKAVRNYTFDDADNYEYEMAMEYDNKVYLSHINFENVDDLADEIYKKVEDLFGVADEDE
tara:strand:- start:559 stop:912 length:354 start_codon:yes stop_codon:yes gene_type:complete